MTEDQTFADMLHDIKRSFKEIDQARLEKNALDISNTLAENGDLFDGFVNASSAHMTGIVAKMESQDEDVVAAYRTFSYTHMEMAIRTLAMCYYLERGEMISPARLAIAVYDLAKSYNDMFAKDERKMTILAERRAEIQS